MLKLEGYRARLNNEVTHSQRRRTIEVGFSTAHALLAASILKSLATQGDGVIGPDDMHGIFGIFITSQLALFNAIRAIRSHGNVRQVGRILQKTRAIESQLEPTIQSAARIFEKGPLPSKNGDRPLEIDRIIGDVGDLIQQDELQVTELRPRVEDGAMGIRVATSSLDQTKLGGPDIAVPFYTVDFDCDTSRGCVDTITIQRGRAWTNATKTTTRKRNPNTSDIGNGMIDSTMTIIYTDLANQTRTPNLIIELLNRGYVPDESSDCPSDQIRYVPNRPDATWEGYDQGQTITLYRVGQTVTGIKWAVLHGTPHYYS